MAFAAQQKQQSPQHSLTMVEGENPEKVKTFAEDLAVVVERELR